MILLIYSAQVILLFFFSKRIYLTISNNVSAIKLQQDLRVTAGKMKELERYLLI